MWGGIYFAFFFSSDYYIFLYKFSGICLNLDVFLSLIPRTSKVLVVASMMPPVQEAWPVLALSWLSRKILVASKYILSWI